MRRKLSIALVLVMSLVIFAGCANDTPATPEQPGRPESSSEAPVTPVPPIGEISGEGDPVFVERSGPMMISVAELQALMDDDRLVLIGAINPTAALVPFSNAANPIRGSYLVWTDDIYGSDSSALSADLQFGRMPLAQMEDLLSRAGITADSIVVAYHSDAAAVGARVAWHLYMLGLDARFLDGGVPAWRAANGRTGSSSRLSGQSVKNDFRAPDYNPSINNVTLEQVIEAAQNPDEWVIIDTRALGEFNGERTGASSGGFGTGRIRGAVHVEWTQAHDADGIRLPEAQLRALYDFIGNRNVIVYCQGGVRSSYSWIVLRDLGFDVWNYDGSWIEWSYAASTASDFPKDVILELTELWNDNGRVIS
ncbi:MAG: rhodanese-like domain-containing protein [Oscillospiraceae bacterium]|nr:rhodanese-like domain-containing protein [Oscillospiraceae bacterium]